MIQVLQAEDIVCESEKIVLGLGQISIRQAPR